MEREKGSENEAFAIYGDVAFGKVPGHRAPCEGGGTSGGNPAKFRKQSGAHKHQVWLKSKI